MALSQNGMLLATGDEKGLLKIWDSNTGELLKERNLKQPLQTIAFSHDDAVLAVALKDTRILIWDTKDF
ncbi:MAG: hypothetical protein Pars2KO_00920 [Parasphingorhabdus sp.]